MPTHFLERWCLFSCSKNSPILWDPKINYCIYKNIELGPIARQSYSLHSFMPYFPENQFNIIPIWYWQDDKNQIHYR
jgi:hypothetical protein